MVEFLDVLDELTDPDDPADAFHVVAPSLPGYGFSGKPRIAGWGVERIAVAWAQLMDRLGYERYGAAGRRLGLGDHLGAGHRGPGERGRHPPDHAAGAAPGGAGRR